MKTLIAAANTLKIEKIVSTATGITIFLTTIQSQPCCPNCDRKATKVHSRYQRQLSDLPWEGIAVRLQLNSRKWFCQNADCAQRIFCERLPELVAPYGRKTLRLSDVLLVIGFALGGRAGSQATQKLALRASARTLLRRVRACAVPTNQTVTKLGVDDFAFRKGQRYGTILVDLERHRIIDLLPDREAATLQAWLQRHPEIQLVSRDRSVTYAEAVTKGAPQAQQVADRFHLVKNLTEAFEQLITRHHQDVRTAARQVSPRELNEAMLRAEGLWPEDGLTPSPKITLTKLQIEQREGKLQKRLARFAQVKQLHREGTPLSVIARQLGLNRTTVRTYLRAEQVPEVRHPYHKPNPAQRFEDYLRQRWEAGCYNARQLYRELLTKGYQGSLKSVRKFITPWRQKLPPVLQKVLNLPVFSPPAPRQVVWWLLKDKEQLTPEQQDFCMELGQVSPAIAQGQKLVQEFRTLLQAHDEEGFKRWRGKVATSGLKELQSFAQGLLKDEAAVRAAFTSEWSNGQVEGQVNKIKMVKRTMYGRASFPLLRARLVGSP
jgi:transposase